MKKIKMMIPALGLVFLAASVPPAGAADGAGLAEKHKCASCHDMIGPAARTIDELLGKKAPDLFYAGSKFQEKFLEDFLQKPYRIRPAGTVYLNHIKSGENTDRIEEPPLCASKLASGEAKEVAKYLMSLKDPTMPTGVYTPEANFSKPMARMSFFKSTACNACHQVEVRGEIKGGVSAPALYDAGRRLNGDWVMSFLKDPRYWEPKGWAPGLNLSENSRKLLTNFVMSMKKEGGDHE